MQEVVVTVIAWLVLLLGLSYMTQATHWAELAKDALRYPHHYFPMVLMILVLGLTVVTLHNVWVADWPVVITVVGWIMVLKSIAYLLLPQVMTVFVSWSLASLTAWIRIAGLVLATLGGALVYLDTVAG
ncbi:MAG: hypothetical protein OEN52_11625 [Gammaproteobacteria bacterium]|nr:hypothetical protein [Gammaproteobacteria bacterium]